MKHIFSLLFAWLLWSVAWTQSFTPVIINGEVFYKTQLEVSNDFLFAEVTVANFEDIGGQLYARTFLKRGFEPDMLVGHLREEPENGRLYFRPQQDPQDILVYDISLEVGDQLTLPARWCDGRNTDVAEVVAVREVDGRRELTFDRTVGEMLICDTLRFLEGVGPSASVIFPYFQQSVPENGVAMSLCHVSREAEIFFPADGATDFCGLDITSTTDLAEQPSLIVYPNPVSDWLFIRQLPNDTKLELYGADGRLYPTELVDEQLDLSGLPKGLLTLVCWRDGQLWHTERILKL